MRRAMLMVWIFGAACERAPRPVSAYVWSRAWGESAHAALRQVPLEIQSLRVLLRERGPRGGWAPVDLDALRATQRPIVAVVRLDGLSDDLTEERARVAAWRRAGVPVAQLEIDFDCAASQLGAYGEWLAALRPQLDGLRLSVTALPSWATAGGLQRALSPADEVVLQVHAVQVPVLFDEAAASRGVHAFARAAGRAVTVALPAYRVTLEGGTPLAADPAAVAHAARALAASEDVAGFAYFRLGSDDDRSAWSPATLAAVVRGDDAALAPHVTVSETDVGVSTRDVWVTNEGRVDAPAPRSLAFSGQVEGAVGYEARAGGLVRAQPLWLRPGERVRVGELLGTSGEGVHVRATGP